MAYRAREHALKSVIASVYRLNESWRGELDEHLARIEHAVECMSQ